MRVERRRFIVSVLIPFICAALMGCGGSEAPAVDLGQAAVQVDALFEPFTEGDSPGAAVAVVRDGAIVHAAGYGLAEIENRTPITPHTAFRLASVSKQFTAMAVMILAERGQLDYDDPLVAYLPELERFGDRITIRHLLTHTGGLPDYYDALEEATSDDMPDTEAAMRFLAGWGEPLFTPGERYEYSNPGYEMVALVVERASGQGFGEFMKANVFEPLGMRHTVVRDASEPEIPNRALGYSRTDEGFELSDEHVLNHIIGSGGVYSTVEDLVRWDQALYTEKLVPRATLETAWSPVQLAGGGDHPYGFGWRLGRFGGLGRRVAHAGGWLGFSTFIVRYPEQRYSVIVLANLDELEAEDFANRITDIYFPSTLIENATVVDGSGAPPHAADVRIVGDRIAEIGNLRKWKDEPVIDGHGLVLSPGFIDTHSHADREVLEHRDALADISQGITTVLTGQCGGSELPLAELFAGLEESPPAVNIASFAGHGTIRDKVMGEDFARPATPEEIESMRALLTQEMEAGALGLSTGLEYDPGIYSTTEEVIELAKVAAAHGGRYVSHIRSEDRRFWDAVAEIIEIGRQAQIPVRISHLKLALRSLHGETERLLGMLDAARAEGIELTADIYPYTYWQSTLTVMFPDRDFEDRDEALFAVEELTTAEDMLIPDFEPEPALAGKTLAEIAALRGTEPATTLTDLIRESEALRAERKAKGEDDDVESVIAVSMTEPDIERLMTWPHINFCTDGTLDGTHPRGFGAFPRVLGHYVRERQVMTLERAIQQMTSGAASSHGIDDRGRIEAGAYADLVLFDPRSVSDRATNDDPHATSEGIEMVWVNGRIVYEDGHPSGRRPGMILRRQPVQ